jgi:arginine/serine-rich splicing factor 17
LEREERRRHEKLELRRQEEERQMQLRIAVEERKILIAQRKLETIRLLSELFNRIKAGSMCYYRNQTFLY